jgi:hypothetical protein
MKKLKLDIDDLAVESFSVDKAGARLGTVQGQDFTLQCGGTNVCTASCNGTCYGSCGGNGCRTIEYVSCDHTCATQDILCGGSGNTTCNQPCGQTCDYTCDVAQTCIQSCVGATCPYTC